MRGLLRSMYITICKTDDHVSLMHDAGHPELVLLDNLEGWGGWEVGKKVCTAGGT